MIGYCVVVGMACKVRFPLENWLWGFILILTTTVALTLLLLNLLPQLNNLEVLVLLVSVGVLYCGGLLIFLSPRGHKRLVNVASWHFAYICMDIAP